jgi:hypothetical protein
MKIIIGSAHNNTANYYKRLELPHSNLITSVDNNEVVGHTSIQDIPDLNELEMVLKSADEVYWAECSPDEFYSDAEYYNFLNWLKDFNLKYKTVKNLDQMSFDVYQWGKKISVTNDQMIFLGCSFTYGIALPNQQAMYSNIVANYFNKTVLNLSEPGGSNNLIFDKFSRLEMNPGQLVVVQFTGLDRIHYCTENSQQLIKLMFARHPTKSMLDVYHKDFLFYELLVKIRSMVNIARAKKLKLVFWLINYKDNNIYSASDQTYFYDMKEFIPASWMAEYLVDFGTDKLHPGVESNKNIANTIIKYIETIYEV